MQVLSKYGSEYLGPISSDSTRLREGNVDLTMKFRGIGFSRLIRFRAASCVSCPFLRQVLRSVPLHPGAHGGVGVLARALRGQITFWGAGFFEHQG